MRRGLMIGILMAAAVYWGMLLLQAEDSVFSRAPLLDELYYLDRAAEVSAGAYPDSEPFFMSPLYPLLVAVTGSGSGLTETGLLPRGGLLGIRLLQVACWFGVVILLRRIAGRTFAATLPRGPTRELVVWFPAFLFALYRPAAVFSLSVLLELPLLLLLTWAMDLITPDPRNPDRPRPWRWPALGAAIGLAALLRGTALLILPVGVWVLWRGTANNRGRARDLIGLILPILVLLAPASIYNSVQAGRPAGPTLNAGLNLYIGNGEQANGFYVNLLSGDWRTDPAGTAHLAAKTGRSAVSVPEADVLWFRATVEAVRQNPARTVKLFLKKVWLHFQGWEIDQLVPLSGWTEEAPLLRALMVPWRLLVVLGLAGIGLLVGRDALVNRGLSVAVRLWGGMLLLLVLGQSLFFVVSRYRLAMVPALCLLAGAALTTSLVRKDGFGRGRAGMLVAGILGMILSQPWGLGSVQENWAGQARANQAHRWAMLADVEDSGMALARAEDLYRKALDSSSTNAEWWFALALVQISRGEASEAETTLAEGDRAFPGNLKIQRTWLGLLLEQNRGDEAVARAEILLRDYPQDAETLHNYAILLARSGRAAEAGQAAGRLIASHPQDPRGYMDLGILLARSGREEEARRIFEQGLTVLPGHPDLERNLSLLPKKEIHHSK